MATSNSQPRVNGDSLRQRLQTQRERLQELQLLEEQVDAARRFVDARNSAEAVNQVLTAHGQLNVIPIDKMLASERKSLAQALEKLDKDLDQLLHQEYQEAFETPTGTVDALHVSLKSASSNDALGLQASALIKAADALSQEALERSDRLRAQRIWRVVSDACRDAPALADVRKIAIRQVWELRVRRFLPWGAGIAGLIVVVAAVVILSKSSGPKITGLDSSSTMAGGPTFVLRVQGENFVDGASWVRWNDELRLTEFVSTTLLTARIEDSDIGAEDRAYVTVFNYRSPRGISNPWPFEIEPAPTPTAMPTSTPTATSTNTPTPTSTAMPTPTPTATPTARTEGDLPCTLLLFASEGITITPSVLVNDEETRQSIQWPGLSLSSGGDRCNADNEEHVKEITDRRYQLVPLEMDTTVIRLPEEQDARLSSDASGDLVLNAEIIIGALEEQHKGEATFGLQYLVDGTWKDVDKLELALEWAIRVVTPTPTATPTPTPTETPTLSPYEGGTIKLLEPGVDDAIGSSRNPVTFVWTYDKPLAKSDFAVVYWLENEDLSSYEVLKMVKPSQRETGGKFQTTVDISDWTPGQKRYWNVVIYQEIMPPGKPYWWIKNHDQPRLLRYQESEPKPETEGPLAKPTPQQ